MHAEDNGRVAMVSPKARSAVAYLAHGFLTVCLSPYLAAEADLVDCKRDDARIRQTQASRKRWTKCPAEPWRVPRSRWSLMLRTSPRTVASKRIAMARVGSTTSRRRSWSRSPGCIGNSYTAMACWRAGVMRITFTRGSCLTLGRPDANAGKPRYSTTNDQHRCRR